MYETLRAMETMSPEELWYQVLSIASLAMAMAIMWQFRR